MVESVCLCLTFKCDLACRHCFVSAGPDRTEEMTYEQIAIAIDNSFKNVNRMWFSGGEPTIIMDKLLFGLRYAKTYKGKYGFPNNICVQTNGNFAQSKDKAIEYLIQFYKNGANEIDITSNDSFHFEQMNSDIPWTLANLANKMGVFDKVTIGGSEYKAVKRFGRAESISLEELENYNFKHNQKCVFTNEDYVIHPNGTVLPCIYGFSNILGNIFDNTLENIIAEDKNIKICNLIKSTGAKNLLYDNHLSNTDICQACNMYIKEYRRKEEQ